MVSLAWEARDVPDPPDDLRSQHRPEAIDLRERGGALFERFCDTSVELADLWRSSLRRLPSRSEAQQVGGQAAPSAPNDGARLRSTQHLGGPVGRDVPARAAHQIPEQSVKVVDGTRAGLHEVIAPLTVSIRKMATNSSSSTESAAVRFARRPLRCSRRRCGRSCARRRSRAVSLAPRASPEHRARPPRCRRGTGQPSFRVRLLPLWPSGASRSAWPTP